MGNSEVHFRRSSDKLRERLVHRVYDLIDQPDGWADVLETIDELIGQDCNTGRHSNIASVLPHIERVNMLLSHIGELELDKQQTDVILNRIPFAMIHIHADCRMISINQRARELLKHITRRNCKKKLQLKKESWQSSLMDAVNAIVSGNSTGEQLRFGHLKLQIYQYGHHEQLYIFLSEHTIEQYICTDTLQGLCGLTGQEAALAAALANGSVRIEDAAAAIGVSTASARNYLKKVFAKTGTRSQAELTKMILCNPTLTMARSHHKQPRKNLLQCQLARLPSGRRISWAEYGDPEGSPLLMCHAITGCRLLVPDDMAVLKKYGIRLIVPDRAGYGLSTPATKDTLTQWLDDIRYFISEIGIEGCDIIGHLAGGVHAKMLAATFPDMVGHLHLISSTAPLQDKEGLEMLVPLYRMVIVLSRHSEPAARAVLKLSFKQAIKNPLHYFEQVKAHISEADHKTLATDGLKERLVSAFAETHRQGVDHMLDECLMIANHYHIKAEKIHCRVTTWHGLQDSHAPVAMMDRFEQGFPLLVNRHRIEGAGHYLLFSHWRQIIKGVAKARAI